MGIELSAAPSVAVTTSATVTAANKTGVLYALTLLSGTTDSSIIIKDGGSGGTDKWELSLNGTTAAGETSESISFPKGVICETDIYATLAGTGAVAYVQYEQIES